MSFVLSVTVSPSEIDEFNHVNNLVYVKWVQDVAVAHSTSLGLGYAEYLARRQAFIVRRHEVDYLRSVLVGELVEVETRVTYIGLASSTRQTEIRRAATKELVAQAQTGWAYVDLERGRPVKIPDDIRARYPLDPPFAWAASTRV